LGLELLPGKISRIVKLKDALFLGLEIYPSWKEISGCWVSSQNRGRE